ncbi:MAG: response regulator transcription factor [Aeromicrobium sp.]|uniref:response regulator n=1 Tax=Aeromicrobium sp. TaxID=1871063 RepID=UPI0039E6A33B
MITVATIDNHPVVREGLAEHLQRNDPEIQVVSSATTVEEYLDGEHRADVVLLDLLLSEGDSLGHIPALLDTGALVLMYTTEERAVPLRRAVAAGASGVLLKSDPLRTVVTAIHQAADGEFCVSGPLANALLTDPQIVANLSERQVQVLRAIDEGLDYRATARVLGVSEGVVKTHLTRIREKYRSVGIKVGNSHHLTRLATDDGYLN